MNLYDMLLPESPYVFYDVGHGFCINTEDVLNLIEQLPSAQFKGINKGVHEITESDRISYSTICDKFPSPHVYFNTYAEAEHWARFNQPNNRPYYIIERSEHFEIVGEVI